MRHLIFVVVLVVAGVAHAAAPKFVEAVNLTVVGTATDTEATDALENRCAAWNLESRSGVTWEVHGINTSASAVSQNTQIAVVPAGGVKRLRTPKPFIKFRLKTAPQAMARLNVYGRRCTVP
jgi:hypothetical protein